MPDTADTPAVIVVELYGDPTLPPDRTEIPATVTFDGAAWYATADEDPVTTAGHGSRPEALRGLLYELMRRTHAPTHPRRPGVDLTEETAR